MNPVSSSRFRKTRKSVQERRAGRRDRHLLEGTMKYRGEYLQVEVVDLSECGAFVLAPAMPELCDIVTLNIDLVDSGSSVMISGRVRRAAPGSRAMRRQGGFGVQFTRFYTRPGKEALKLHLAA